MLPADVNHNGTVTIADSQALSAFIAANGAPFEVPPQPDPQPGGTMYYDVDNNSVVDEDDVTAVYSVIYQSITITAVRDTTREVRPPNVAPDQWPGLIRFTRSSGTLADSLTVNIHAGGSATSGVDYATLPTSITFGPGDDVYDLYVTPVRDDKVDSQYNEVVQVTITDVPIYPYGINGEGIAIVEIVDNDYWAWDHGATIGGDWMWGGPPVYPQYVPWGVLSDGSFSTQGAASPRELDPATNEVGLTVGGFARWTEPGWFGYYDPVEVSDGFNQNFGFNPSTGQITITENGDGNGKQVAGDLEFAIASEYQYDNEGDDEHWVQIDLDVAWSVAGTVTKTASAELLGFKAESSRSSSQGVDDAEHHMFKFFLRRHEHY